MKLAARLTDLILLWVLSLLVATEAFACAETFENEDWTFESGAAQKIGTPVAFLQSEFFTAFIPQVLSSRENCFVDGVRQHKQQVFELAMRVFQREFPIKAGVPLSMVLWNNNDLQNQEDDFGVVIPERDGHTAGTNSWTTARFDIPGAQQEWPRGAKFLSTGPDTPPESSWTEFLTNVDQISVAFGDPTRFAIAQKWQIGVGQMRLTTQE